MLFRSEENSVLAISQPAHAWISGQILRAWNEELSEPLLLAAEQHDLAWLDWEAAPSFDANTGRPHSFRDVGAASHAPMWAKGVQWALNAWGMHVALLISRHGGGIYRRVLDRMAEPDQAAARHYLNNQAALQDEWIQALGLDAADLHRQTALVAFADALSLALCGDLPAPMELEAPGSGSAPRTLRLANAPGQNFHFTLDPWPFRPRRILFAGEGRLLPPGGRLEDASGMQDWLATAPRTEFRTTLSPAGLPLG